MKKTKKFWRLNENIIIFNPALYSPLTVQAWGHHSSDYAHPSPNKECPSGWEWKFDNEVSEINEKRQELIDNQKDDMTKEELIKKGNEYLREAELSMEYAKIYQKNFQDAYDKYAVANTYFTRALLEKE